jgi:hypothetical protein
VYRILVRGGTVSARRVESLVDTVLAGVLVDPRGPA